MNLGRRLSGLREEHGLSREELAKRLGLSYWAVAKYETDERMPSPDVLSRLAEIFSVSVDYLLGLASDSGPSKNQSFHQEADGPDLPDWVKKLPPDMQEFVQEESKHGWPYLRLARGLKMKDLSPAELEAIVETWIEAKRNYEKTSGNN